MLHFRAPSLVRRLGGSIATALLLGILAASPTAAADPGEWLLDADREDLRQPPLLHVPTPEPTPTPSATPEPTPEPPPTPTPTATPEPTPEPTPDPVGLDVSYPQCGRDLPQPGGFAVVGVNGGRVFDLNPCLAPTGLEAGQLAWAGQEVELYFNTGNPGPRWSRYWPAGSDEPRQCETSDNPVRDTLDCAFNYGWNAAEHAYQGAVDAYVELGWLPDDAQRLPANTTVWLDVEESNSWRNERDRNVASLEGAVAFLESVDVGRIGFYSVPRLWDRITGGTDAFADYPAWHAGAHDRADAARRCVEEEAFTGGELVMVQWVEDGLDHNLRCEAVTD